MSTRRTMLRDKGISRITYTNVKHIRGGLHCLQRETRTHAQERSRRDTLDTKVSVIIRERRGAWQCSKKIEKRFRALRTNGSGSGKVEVGNTEERTRKVDEPVGGIRSFSALYVHIIERAIEIDIDIESVCTNLEAAEKCEGRGGS